MKNSVKINGHILQNCFACDSVPAYDVKSKVSEKKYFELQQKTVDNGIVEQLVECDYPITPAYVQSFADSSDYHVDPVSKIMHGGQNLGDVSSVQQVLNDDVSTVKRKYADFLSTLERVNKSFSSNAKKEDAKNV